MCGWNPGVERSLVAYCVEVIWWLLISYGDNNYKGGNSLETSCHYKKEPLDKVQEDCIFWMLKCMHSSKQA